LSYQLIAFNIRISKKGLDFSGELVLPLAACLPSFPLSWAGAPFVASIYDTIGQNDSSKSSARDIMGRRRASRTNLISMAADRVYWIAHVTLDGTKRE
jgi:hypothetical protein